MGEGKIIPLGDRILVLPEKEEEVTESGILVTLKQETEEAVVLRIGDQVGAKTQYIKEGAKIIYNKSAGTTMPKETEGTERDVKILRYLDVIAVTE